MEIYHRITFGSYENVKSELDAMQIQYKVSELGGTSYIMTFDIVESDPRWPHVAALVRAKEAPDFFETVFDDQEVLAAKVLRLVVTYEQGYPQPKSRWFDKRPNWDNYCKSCGTHRQISSYYITREPTLRRIDFMALFWGDGIFAKHEVFAGLTAHNINGFEKWDVLLRGAKQPSKVIAQLFLPVIARPGFIAQENVRSVECSSCNARKYAPNMRGIMYFRGDALPADVDMLQTYEWFGGGTRAYRETLVTNRVARLAIENGWKGVRFKVVELV